MTTIIRLGNLVVILPVSLPGKRVPGVIVVY